MKPLFGSLIIMALPIVFDSSLGAQLHCKRYKAEKTPLEKLEGDWFVQDYSNAGSAFENQTCIKLNFHVDKHAKAAAFNKTWIDKCEINIACCLPWRNYFTRTNQIQYREFLIVQDEPAGMVFLNSNDPSWKIKSSILRLTDDGTFIHSSCELNGPWVQNERITTATRKRQVDRQDWLQVYDSLGNQVFQDHTGVSQNNCVY